MKTLIEPLTIPDINAILPHRYPFLLVDRIIDFESRKRIVGLKNVSINEPFFQGHFSDEPVMPGVLILESLAQAGATLLLRDPEFSGRYALLNKIDKVEFLLPVTPGDQVRLEVDIKKIKDNSITLNTQALVDGRVVCKGLLAFNLAHSPSKPQIHATASVHRTAILGKNVEVGPNTIIGEHVVIGDNTIIEGHCFLEKWTQIGDDCHIHFGSIIGSAAQDISYKGEKSWVVIGDRNQIREYVTINRATGKDTVTKIGDDNLLLTSVHIAHNCQLGNNIIIANSTNLAGHAVIEDRVTIGGMTGVHQFARIGYGAMVGAYTCLPQDVPPFMLCEGNPAEIHGVNLIGMRRSKIEKTAINEVKDIYKHIYRSEYNMTQAITLIKKQKVQSKEAKQTIAFILANSKRGITKKVKEAPIKDA